ncbi:MAG: threonine--tRNA ligase [Proteobacteria bacterium]|nr:threonine--tRNA ligase [Pseudomonadota bacterium]
MPTITLPDGAQRTYKQAPTALAVAHDISPSLAKAALAAKLDDVLVDLSQTIAADARFELITNKHADALPLIRHDCAHVLAEAVLELYPETQVTIGPPIDNGFYYDFHRPTPFTETDLASIEARMHEIIDRNQPFVCEVWSRKKALDFYKDKNEPFKIEIIDSIPKDQPLRFYRQGGFIDLCRGPHAPETGRIGHAFKLMHVAGAYWRGDSTRPMLQRIYGTAFFADKDLKAYLTMLEEAAKRDHRKLGKALDLFHIQEAAAGSVFWHPKGWIVYREIENYMRRRLDAADYVEVKTPQLIDRSLWQASGHWDKFGEHMFVAESEDDRVLALKPMNCPGHVQIYRQGIKSYRDLPLRMAEFGSCHRNEPSGALHGIMRVRAFTQDDAHIFCTEDQINDEGKRFCDLLLDIYRDFGFRDVKVKFADRPPVRSGDDATWQKAEDALTEATKAAGLEATPNPGEGAFYGPKLEFVLVDAIGREWQCGTLQVDFVLPSRLDAEYVGEDGNRHRPVMLHRAILGSLERWIGILLEQYSGRLPLWLAPVQCVIAPITDAVADYAHEIFAHAQSLGLRAELDSRNEKINYKVRAHSLAKVPYLLVVGEKEKQAGTIAVRQLGQGEDKDSKQTIQPAKKALADIAKSATPPDLRAK